MKILAIYPGRFHPFHKGHAASFKQLASKFGLDNTYLAISAKQEQPKSPFSARERAKMAETLGIPTDHIIVVANPYSAKEYIDKFEPLGYDPEHTALIFGVSKKDMEGDPEMGIPPDPRFSFAAKKDGSASYLQPWTGKEPIQPMSKHGYIMSTNVAEFPIAGKTMRDASAIRSAYAGADTKTKMRILTDLYGDKAEKMKQIFDNNLQITESAASTSSVTETKISNENIKNLVNRIKPLLAEATVEQKTRFVQLLSEAKKTLRNTNPCWTGYKPVGTKKKNGKTVTNCVPVNESLYRRRDLDITHDLGDGYYLSTYVDDDDDVTKIMYSVFKAVPDQEDKYQYLDSLNVSPYPNNIPPGRMDSEINRVISADKNISKVDEVADYLEEK